MKKLATTLLATVTAVSLQAKPQTLLEMAGVQIPFETGSSVLVLIDFQQEYTVGKLPLYQIDSVVRESQRLLEFARRQQIPVVHVLHKGSAGGIFDPNGIGASVIPQLAPLAGEAVVYKTLPNGFAGTELEKTIRRLGKSSIVFAGLMTHMCVEATVRGAQDRGFNSVVVASTTTTRDLPGVNGKAVDAETLKAASLASLQDLVATVDANVGSFTSRYGK